MKKKTIKILTAICFVLIIVIINSLLNFWNTPIIDCTQDKKYTLSEETQEILSKVEDKIFFKIYFEGKGFTEEMVNYRNEIERLLIKLQYYSPLIEYVFVDINSYTDIKKSYDNDDNDDIFCSGCNQKKVIAADFTYICRDSKCEKSEKKEITKITESETATVKATELEKLAKKGIIITEHPNIKNNYIPWGGTVTYGKYNYEKPLLLLSDLDAMKDVRCVEALNDDVCLFNNRAKDAINKVEYTLVNAIKNAIEYKPEIQAVSSIGILIKNKETNIYRLSSIKRSLQKEEGYNVSDFTIIDNDLIIENFPNKETNPLGKLYDCIIIHAADEFEDFEKLIIDQFIMNGGKTIWLIDGLKANMNYLSNKESFVLEDYNNNTDSLLSNYGVIIENNIIRESQSSSIKMPNNIFYNWDYFPLLKSTQKHPITKNIDLIKGQFISSIDTINTKKIKKTILLESSENYNIVTKNDVVSLRHAFTNNVYENNTKQIIAILLEGTFRSKYQNTTLKNMFRKKSDYNKMIVISDGDLFLNDLQMGSGLALPLGYDDFTYEKFDNSTFAINCINYLLNESDKNLFEIKNKELNSYSFNPEKLRKNKQYWILINNSIPILLVLTIGSIIFILRRKKYSK